MKLYRLTHWGMDGEHYGFSFFGSQREVKQADVRARRDGERTEIVEVAVTPTKAGILAALNEYADHADNG